jgi:AraC-like DNA-binding protein
MRIHIKNMVCRRCILAVQQEAEKLGIACGHIQLGVLETPDELPPAVMEKFGAALNGLGFEIIGDKKSRLIEQVKSLVIERIHHGGPDALSANWSAVIADSLPYEYNYISNLFSAVEGITIEQFIIRQKIEKAKELIVYDELSLSEIAYRMGYSSAAYLANQFKKNTGMTPGQFRRLRGKERKGLDQL